jgi:hypothetical protein
MPRAISDKWFWVMGEGKTRLPGSLVLLKTWGIYLNPWKTNVVDLEHNGWIIADTTDRTVETTWNISSPKSNKAGLHAGWGIYRWKLHARITPVASYFLYNELISG